MTWAPAVHGGKGSDERLADGADERRGGGGGVVRGELPALYPFGQRLLGEVAVAPAEDEALLFDGRVDRLGDERVGAGRLGERAPRECLDAGAHTLVRRSA